MDSANDAVYISSTDAGILFNDKGFNTYLKQVIRNDELFDNTSGITPLYEETNASGKITLQAANGESVKVQAFNDFFSENYIKGIKSSNVKTIFSGDILARNGEGLNAFCRTEFEAIINNSNIKTINGIDKEILFELKNAAPKGKEYQYVTDVLNAA